MSDNRPLALNGETDDGVPVVIEYPEFHPFDEGEREQDWHVATEDELRRYYEFWNHPDRDNE